MLGLGMSGAGLGGASAAGLGGASAAGGIDWNKIFFPKSQADDPFLQKLLENIKVSYQGGGTSASFGQSPTEDINSILQKLLQGRVPSQGTVPKPITPGQQTALSVFTPERFA